jgi:hypothetical protein
MFGTSLSADTQALQHARAPSMQLASLILGVLCLMLLARTPLAFAAASNPKVSGFLPSTICSTRRPLAVITSAQKASGRTTGMAEVKDVAPVVLNTIDVTIKYGGKAILDGQRLGKAQVRHRSTQLLIVPRPALGMVRGT